VVQWLGNQESFTE